MAICVSELSSAAAIARLGDLTVLTRDVVDAGAHLGWEAPMDDERASRYWCERVPNVDGQNLVLFAAFLDGRLCGTVQLERGHFPTSTHRAEVMKLMVSPRDRRRGVASQLMDALESRAVRLGMELLVLDTRAGEPVEELYDRRGYVRTGYVPGWMKYASGAYRDTVFFYKDLR